jgi:hypothetical protein
MHVLLYHEKMSIEKFQCIDKICSICVLTKKCPSYGQLNGNIYRYIRKDS